MSAIQRLVQLRAGWDSYKGAPLSASAVRRCFSLLPSLLPLDGPDPSVVPTRDGGVQFEWHRGGIDIENTIPPAGQVNYFVADASENLEEEWQGTLDRNKIRAAFAKIVA